MKKNAQLPCRSVYCNKENRITPQMWQPFCDPLECRECWECFSRFSTWPSFQARMPHPPVLLISLLLSDLLVAPDYPSSLMQPVSFPAPSPSSDESPLSTPSCFPARICSLPCLSCSRERGSGWNWMSLRLPIQFEGGFYSVVRQCLQRVWSAWALLGIQYDGHTVGDHSAFLATSMYAVRKADWVHELPGSFSAIATPPPHIDGWIVGVC